MHSERPTERTRQLRSLIIGFLATLLGLATLSTAGLARESFPEAAPESVGMSAEALAELAGIVEDYVEREMAVGAELVVINDDRRVLHEAFGWRDREAEVPMERDTVFNIRSMTKPVTGAAIQALIDDGLLALDDRAADYLPGFDTDASRDITIEQLLTHRSGLPLTTVASVDQYEDLEALANAAGERGPEFEPGSKFWYSDAGADVLGAIVERASGIPLDEFVSERLLAPLGMEDSLYISDAGDPRLERVASLYAGRMGEWTRFWGPEQEPFYPYAWGSQSLYATPLDYARFLTMWLDEGMSGDTRVLSAEAVARMLTPTGPMGSLGSDAPYLTLYSDLVAHHGQMAILYMDEEETGGDPVVLGYSGSDGTIAWAWPERDLLILFFTQSRGGSSPLRLEAEIERLLLDPPEVPDAGVPAEYEDYLGTYAASFDQFRNEPFEVIWRDGALALDIPSLFIFGLEPTDEDGWWSLGDTGAAVSFATDEAGVVTGLGLRRGGETFDLPKGAPEMEPEPTLAPEEAERYLGWFREEGTGREVEVVLRDGQLALRTPETTEPLALFPPDEDGRWRLRLNTAVGISFTESDGVVDGYFVSSPLGEATFTRIEAPTDP